MWVVSFGSNVFRCGSLREAVFSYWDCLKVHGSDVVHLPARQIGGFWVPWCVIYLEKGEIEVDVHKLYMPEI